MSNDASKNTDAFDPFASEQVITCQDDRLGLQAVIAIDNTTLGPGFGGTRWRPYPSVGAAVAEAQRLAAAMTLKHALADLPYGGAKSVIIADGPLPAEGSTERAEIVGRFGEFVARTAGTYIPGVDMGTLISDMQVIRDRGARAFCADRDPGPFTAAGAYAAMRAAVRHDLDRDMAGIRVAIQGAGHVGENLARLAAADGAELLIADIDPDRAHRVAESVGGSVVAPEQILTTECDVLAPCAVARVLTSDIVGALRCRVVSGAANDTLDRPEVAAELQRAGITFVPDFIANAGGVIQVHADEVGWSAEQLDDALERIGDRVEAVLRMAATENSTSLAAALQIAVRRLAGD